MESSPAVTDTWQPGRESSFGGSAALVMKAESEVTHQSLTGRDPLNTFSLAQII